MPGTVARRRAFLLNRWTPRSFPRLLDYWDARRLALSGTSAVSSWKGELSAHTWIQGTGSAQPTLDPDALNALPGVTFATDDFMTADTLAASVTGDDTPFLLSLVMARTDVASTTEAFFSFGRNAATGYVRIRDSTAAVLQLTRRGDGEAETTANMWANPNTIGAGPVVVTLAFRGTTFDAWRDRMLVRTGIALNTGACTITQATLGCLRVNANSEFADYSVGAVAVAAGSPSNNDIYRLVDYHCREFRIAS